MEDGQAEDPASVVKCRRSFCLTLSSVVDSRLHYHFVPLDLDLNPPFPGFEPCFSCSPHRLYGFVLKS